MGNQVSLFRSGTRVLSSLAEIDALNIEPWNGGYLQGMIDAPFLQLTPGTRTGVIHDESFDSFTRALAPVGERLKDIIAREKEAEEEQASRNILKSVQKAFKEAFLTLPPEDYDWFDLHTGKRRTGPVRPEGSDPAGAGDDSTDPSMPADSGSDPKVPGTQVAAETPEAPEPLDGEREFFNYPGPLFGAVIVPSSVVMKVNSERGFRCIPRDKSRRTLEEGVEIRWSIDDGEGQLSSDQGEITSLTAPAEPGLTVLRATVTQGDTVVAAKAMVTVSEELIEREPGAGEKAGKGLPGYTYLRAPGELWRSRYDEKNNLVVVNNGHRDYLYAAQKHARKLKYICRLFAKELVLANFPGFDSRELLERVIELSLYAEENLR